MQSTLVGIASNHCSPFFIHQMNFETFYQNFIREYIEDDKGQRFGQFFMNKLAEVNLELYQAVPADLDPFYNNKLMNSATEWVADRWAMYN